MTVSTLRLAFYARVSSDHQAEQGTIASQVEALRQRIAADGGRVEPELEFCDDGCPEAIFARLAGGNRRGPRGPVSVGGRGHRFANVVHERRDPNLPHQAW